VVPQHLIHHLLRLIEVAAPGGVIDLLPWLGSASAANGRRGGDSERQGGRDKRSSNEISHVQPQDGPLGR